MLGAIAAAALAATTFNVDVAAKVGDRLDEAKVPVYYPSTVPSERRKVFVETSTVDVEYGIQFNYTKDCSGADVCSFGFIYGEDGGSLRTKGKRIRLAQGIVGRYYAPRCGANCSNPAIGFRTGGVAYTFDFKVAKRKQIKRLANSAILAGPRN